MATEFEIAISPDYVPDWGVVEAFRELYQNAMDQSATDPSAEMSFEYDEVTGVVKVSNKDSELKVNSLLIGKSSKRDDDKTVGKFGEGYKLAVMVLLREGKEVTIYNNKAGTVWVPKLKESEKYGEVVLSFEVRDHQSNSKDLVFEVKGVTEEEYAAVVESNLNLQDDVEYIETAEGKVLTSPKHKGKVFVNGLFVCDYEKYDFGYDFKSDLLRLDRDRKLVSDFDLKWLSSHVWASALNDLALSLVKEGSADVEYLSAAISHAIISNGFIDVGFSDFAEAVAKDFYEEYGASAYPVSDNDEFNRVSKIEGVTPVFVNSEYKNIIKSSSVFREEEYLAVSDPKSRLAYWIEKYCKCLPDEAVEEFEEILSEI